jgi:type I restriction enzyme S subunit
MKWSVYPDYKESGVEWLGDVPRHWRVDRLKWSVKSSQNGVWGEEADGGADDIRCVRVADFDRPKLRIQDRDVTYRKVTPQEQRGRLLTQGDLILEKSGGGEKSPVGFVVLYDRDDPAVTSNFLARVSLQPTMEPRFWTYLHSSLYRSRLTQPSIKQTSGIQNLDQQSYFDERVCFPPFEEQEVIAEWLDAETTKVDALIAKQEQLIAALREDRTATITHAVTNGLDPDVPMEDSGVDWLPTFPAGWVATPLKHVCVVRDCKHLTAEFVDAGYPLASIREVQSRYVDLTHAKRTTEVYYKQLGEGGRSPQPGDLIFSRNATVGEVAQVVEHSEPFAMGQDVCLLRPAVDRLHPDYAWYVLRSQLVGTQIELLMIGSTFKRINVEEIKSLVVTCPPLAEQQEIVNFLDVRCGGIEALIAKAQDVVDTLREYRSALITDAVTGKIDVRRAA